MVLFRIIFALIAWNKLFPNEQLNIRKSWDQTENNSGNFHKWMLFCSTFDFFIKPFCHSNAFRVWQQINDLAWIRAIMSYKCCILSIWWAADVQLISVRGCAAMLRTLQAGLWLHFHCRHVGHLYSTAAAFVLLHSFFGALSLLCGADLRYFWPFIFDVLQQLQGFNSTRGNKQ